MKYIKQNELEQLTSEDINDRQKTVHETLYDKILYQFFKRENGCIYDSFSVSRATSTTVTVKAGLAFFYDASQVSPEPKYRAIKLNSDLTLTVNDSVGTAGTWADTPVSDSRIDIIVIKPRSEVLSTVARNVKDGVGTVAIQSVDKIIDQTYDIDVVEGASDASPVAPSVPVGWMKIGEVLLTSGSDIADASDVTDLRTELLPNFEVLNDPWISKDNSDSPYSLLTTDVNTLVDTSSGEVEIVLPNATTLSGSTYRIKKDGSDVNKVRIKTTSSQTINLKSNYLLYVDEQTVVLISDGSNWLLVGDSGYKIDENKKVLANITTRRWYDQDDDGQDNQWRSVAWSKELGLFCAVATQFGSSGNQVVTSPDGINWTKQVHDGDRTWLSVIWAKELGLFVAVAADGLSTRVMTSPDGVTWTNRTSSVDNLWYSVCWSKELSLLVAVAGSGTGDRVMTSPDGINWTTRVSASDDQWVKVIWVKELGLFVAVGSDSTGGNQNVMTSPDGINWTNRVPAGFHFWFSLTWSEELNLIVAVANSASSGEYVMTSPDGINWSYATNSIDLSLVDIVWAKSLGIFLAISSDSVQDGIVISHDGNNWVRKSGSNNNDWRAVAWSEELSMFAVVGASGSGNRIMTSI